MTGGLEDAPLRLDPDPPMPAVHGETAGIGEQRCCAACVIELDRTEE